VNRLELRSVTGRRFGPLDRVFESGAFTLLSKVSDGAGDLFSTLIGRTKPKRGAVLLNGNAPFRSPETRRSIASLSPIEVFEGRTIGESVHRVLGVRNRGRSGREVLERFDLSNWSERSPATLGLEDARAVALALAFDEPAPALLALFEPLRVGLPRERVIREISEHVARGTIAVAITASPRDAADLGGCLVAFDRGRFDPSFRLSSARPGQPSEFVVLVDDARRLAAALSEHAAVATVRVDASARPSEVFVSGVDRDGVALAIEGAIQSTGVSVRAILQSPPRTSGAYAAPGAGARTALEERDSNGAASPHGPA
jgi:ABC-type thiamine transport system ATPase subunit